MMLISHAIRRRLRERARLLFGGTPRRMQTAALPWRLAEDGVEVLLVTSRGTGRWVLPKGWPEGGETLYEAAAREAEEEAGVRGAVGRCEVGRYHYAKKLRSGAEWLCEVPVFAFEVDEVAERWPEMKERRRQWFAPHEAARYVAEPDLSELIAGFGVNPRKFAA